ncbi:hypothetical protein GQ457_08G024100 [Hibiscus cannabinus]
MEIKDSSASCHKKIKLLISPVKIQDWHFLRLIEEQGFSILKFIDWFEKLYGSRSSLVREFVKRFVVVIDGYQGTHCKFFRTLPPGFDFRTWIAGGT